MVQTASGNDSLSAGSGALRGDHDALLGRQTVDAEVARSVGGRARQLGVVFVDDHDAGAPIVLPERCGPLVFHHLRDGRAQRQLERRGGDLGLVAGEVADERAQRHALAMRQRRQHQTDPRRLAVGRRHGGAVVERDHVQQLAGITSHDEISDASAPPTMNETREPMLRVALAALS